MDDILCDDVADGGDGILLGGFLVEAIFFFLDATKRHN